MLGMKIFSPLSSFHSLSHIKTSGQRPKLYFKLYCQHVHSSQKAVTVPARAVLYSLKRQNLFSLSCCDYFFILQSWANNNAPTGQKDELHKCLEVNEKQENQFEANFRFLQVHKIVFCLKAVHEICSSVSLQNIHFF